MELIENILIVVGLLLLTFRLWWPLLSRFIIKKASEKESLCEICKGVQDELETYLYLIPVQFDHTYEKSAEYYIQNTTPITDESQIPSGNRAVRMTILMCRNCAAKEVVVVDFLKVRDSEVFKGCEVYSYDKFRDFFEGVQRNG